MTGHYISEMSYKRLKDKPEYNREKLWLIKSGNKLTRYEAILWIVLFDAIKFFIII